MRGTFLLQLEIALLVLYLFVVFKDCIVVRKRLFQYILFMRGIMLHVEKQIKKSFRSPPCFK